MKTSLFDSVPSPMEAGAKKNLTPAFSLLQAPFWATYAVSVGFAAVYLQALGYSNRELGLVMAAGFLLSVFAGPLLSSWIDRSPCVTASRLFPWGVAAQIASLLLLLLFPHRGPAAWLGYLLYIALSNAANSLNLKLYADALHAGARIDYGFGRGVGSLGYVLVSVALGFVAERISVRAIPVAGIILCLLQYAAFVRFRRLSPVGAAGGGDRPRGSSLLAFARGNRRFCVLLLGTALMFFDYNAVSNFMINVVRNLGGDASTMGSLIGFMAAVEIPTMILYSRVFKGPRSSALALSISFVFLSLKAAGVAAASTIPQLTAVILLQIPSFALYTAAIVPYVTQTVPYEDSAKAQSLAYTMTLVGSVLASLLAGPMYDVLSVTATLWIACGVCVAGTVIALFGTERGKGAWVETASPDVGEVAGR